MPCDLCPHCTAPPVLRLPRQRKSGDTARYDRAVLDAYATAQSRSRQPMRLLLQVNPWLNRPQLREQLNRARQRGAMAGVDPDALRALLESKLWVYYHTVAHAVPEPEHMVLQGLAATEVEARHLLAAAIAAQGKLDAARTAARHTPA